MWRTKAIQGLLVVVVVTTRVTAQQSAPLPKPSAPLTQGATSWSAPLRLPSIALPPPALDNSGPTTCNPAASPQSPLTVPSETLEQAWACALALDPLVQADQFGAAAAEQRLRAARAARLPDVGVDVAYIVRDNEPAFLVDTGLGLPIPTGTRLLTNQREALQFGTLASVPLFTSGRVRRGIDAATARVESAQLQVETTAMDLKIRVAAAYAAVLRGQRDLAVADTRIRSLEAHLHDLSILHQHQQVPRNDVLAARVELANARQDKVQAYNTLDAARASYNRLLQRPLDSEVNLAGLGRPLLVEDVPALTERALRLRPVLENLTAQMRALEQQAAAIDAARKPQFDLLGRYVFEENRFRSPEGIASVAVGMHWNALDGGRKRYEATALQQESARLGRIRADVEWQIRLEVRRAWLDAKEADHRIEITQEALEHAAENLRIARERYAAGSGSNTEVLDAVTLQTVTERNLDAAIYDAALAFLRLRRATGEL